MKTKTKCLNCDNDLDNFEECSVKDLPGMLRDPDIGLTIYWILISHIIYDIPLVFHEMYQAPLETIEEIDLYIELITEFEKANDKMKTLSHKFPMAHKTIEIGDTILGLLKKNLKSKDVDS